MATKTCKEVCCNGQCRCETDQSCINDACCSTPNKDGTECCDENGKANDGTCCPALTTQGCDTETDTTTGCLKCKQSATSCSYTRDCGANEICCPYSKKCIPSGGCCISETDENNEYGLENPCNECYSRTDISKELSNCEKEVGNCFVGVFVLQPVDTPFATCEVRYYYLEPEWGGEENAPDPMDPYQGYYL